MIQIEEYNFENKRELHARERYWLEQLKATLNKVVPTRTNKEYQDEHKEQQKQYRQDNIEHIKENQKQWYRDNIEHIKQYHRDNVEHIKEHRKQYNKDNAEHIKQRQKQYAKDNAERLKQKFDCPCGSRYTYANRTHHFKTKRHCQYEYDKLYNFIYS